MAERRRNAGEFGSGPAPGGSCKLTWAVKRLLEPATMPPYSAQASGPRATEHQISLERIEPLASEVSEDQLSALNVDILSATLSIIAITPRILVYLDKMLQVAAIPFSFPKKALINARQAATIDGWNAKSRTNENATSS